MFLLNITEFAGRLHPLLVHLPIGILLLGVLLHWLSVRRSELIPAVKIVLWLGTLGSILSCVSGWLLAAGGDYESATLDQHRWMGIAVAIAAGIYYYIFKTKFSARSLLRGKMGISLVVIALVGFTGHLGGTLTHGEGYLLSVWDSEAVLVSKKEITDVQQAIVYEDIIAPLLAQKCYSCHGTSKQRGKLRLDSYEMIKKGGEEGNTLLPGSPEASNLFSRLVLDESDKKRMPPKGRSPLSKNEIALIHWWIASGATVDKPTKDLEQTAEIKLLLATLEKSQSEAIAIVPVEPIEPASPEAIASLEVLGATVTTVATNSNYLSVNFLGLSSVTDEQALLLEPLAEHVVWLKMGGTNISDKGLTSISQLKKLTRLHINNLAITDEGIRELAGLQQLQYLNLTGTKITTSGLESLASIPGLQSLFIYKTGVNAVEEIEKLKVLFPATYIDAGGYIVPTLPTDTIVVTKGQ